MTVDRLRALGAIVAVASTLLACSDDERRIAWDIEASADLRARITSIEAAILVGGCEGMTDAWRARFDAEDPSGEAPGALEPGRYGFWVRARDADCAIVAEGCVAMDWPATATIMTPLSTASGPACAADERCTDGECIATDASIDAHVPDAETDAATMDAGALDAGPDASMDARVPDAQTDFGVDARVPDAEIDDAEIDGSKDAGPPDAGRCMERPTGDPTWPRYPLPGAGPRSYAMGDETVIDCVTGLEWQRDVAPIDPDAGTPDAGAIGRTHSEAIAYCEAATTGGFDDWRLPSTIELMTLVDYAIGEPGPAIDSSAFPGTPGARFWTGSTRAGSMGVFKWAVQFANGIALTWHESEAMHVRCVR